MIKFRQLVSNLAKTSKELLAIIGLLGLIVTAYKYIDDPFRNIKEPDIKIRPIYQLLAVKPVQYSNGTLADVKLIGIEIKNKSDISDLKIKINGIYYAEKWAMSSTGVSADDSVKFIATAPSGPITNSEIYLNLPRIMANSDTIIQFDGITIQDFDPTSDWFYGSSGTREVYHYMYGEPWAIREWSYKFNTIDFYTPGFYILLILVVGFLIYKHITKKATNQTTPSLESKVTQKEAEKASEELVELESKDE